MQLLAKEQETHFARLGKLEAMSSKLQTTYEITVKAIHCKEVGIPQITSPPALLHKD